LALAATTIGVIAGILSQKGTLQNWKMLYFQPVSVIVVAFAAFIYVDGFLREDWLEMMITFILAILLPNIYQIYLIGKRKGKQLGDHREKENLRE
jgi:hypothetical protein